MISASTKSAAWRCARRCACYAAVTFSLKQAPEHERLRADPIPRDRQQLKLQAHE